MIKYKVCATSANLGIGFDIMGLALDIYNTFGVELSSKWEFIGFQKEFESEDNNLFVKSYNKALEYKGLVKDCLKVEIKSEIPLSRGLGSSSSLVVGGIYACSLLHGNCFNKDEMFKLASEIEGHPDNVAPCIFGGLCVVNNGNVLKINVDERYKFSLLVSDIEISTKKARQVLPEEYLRSDVVNNVSSALFSIKALEEFDEVNIKCLMNDKLHEPYRKTLIPHFDEIKEYILSNGGLALVISGSGSSMLVVSNKELEIKDRVFECDFIRTKINKEGIIDV